MHSMHYLNGRMILHLFSERFSVFCLHFSIRNLGTCEKRYVKVYTKYQIVSRKVEIEVSNSFKFDGGFHKTITCCSNKVNTRVQNILLPAS